MFRNSVVVLCMQWYLCWDGLVPCMSPALFLDVVWEMSQQFFAIPVDVFLPVLVVRWENPENFQQSMAGVLSLHVLVLVALG